MMDPVLREVYRSRWRREREGLRFLDIQQEVFGTGGLGRYAPNLAVRLVILPGDPNSEPLEFNEQFWDWWAGEHGNPLEGMRDEWGNARPTTSAAVRWRSLSDDPWKWDSYLALHRHGGLDIGLGRDGAVSLDATRRSFLLVRIVGRVWTALHLYGEAVARFKIDGPWECSVVLLRTQGAKLGGFGSGWASYNDPDANPLPCLAPNLWWRRELAEWPQPEATRDLAFSIGGWIEDSWGMSCRRFLARTGPLAGQFDTASYRSY